jgi:hypothetical protein
MHICGDEIMALAMALPFVGIVFAWFRSKVKAAREWVDSRGHELSEYPEINEAIDIYADEVEPIGLIVTNVFDESMKVGAHDVPPNTTVEMKRDGTMRILGPDVGNTRQ